MCGRGLTIRSTGPIAAGRHLGYKSLAQMPTHRNRPVSSNVRRHKIRPRSVAKLLELKYPKERLIQEVARLQAKCKPDRLCSISMSQIRLKSLENLLKRNANGRPACGIRCIFTTRALVSCRRRPLSSNVSLVSRNSQHC